MKISKISKEKIRELLVNKTRLDGRNPLDLREFSVELNVSSKAEGSARVKLGDTEVIAGIKMDLLEPFSDTPEEGVLMVSAELSPLASDDFESGPPGIEAITLARIVDRSIRESGFIDFKKLCVKPGELVWGVFLDIYPINDDGNLTDAAALAAVYALLETRLPKLDGEKVEHDVHSDKKLPLNAIPVTLTAHKVDGAFIIDPTSEEEGASKMKLAISVTYEEHPIIHGILKSGEEPIEIDNLIEMVQTLITQGKKIHDKILKSKK
jgi:exosome complex component RRP42